MLKVGIERFASFHFTITDSDNIEFIINMFKYDLLPILMI